MLTSQAKTIAAAAHECVCAVWSYKFFCELYLCATTSRGPQICCYGIGISVLHSLEANSLFISIVRRG
eukprot:5659502-Prymnesium_polylepis.1